LAGGKTQKKNGAMEGITSISKHHNNQEVAGALHHPI
jgi:hypothetical protein